MPAPLSGAILGTIALVIGFWAFSHRHSQTGTNAVTSPEKLIAVLPFKPLLAEYRDQVLEMGMADSLIAKLSNIREIVVRSLNSVRKYSGLDQDPLAAGRELEVNSVLEGNVQRSSDRIRVTARLIKGSGRVIALVEHVRRKIHRCFCRPGRDLAKSSRRASAAVERPGEEPFDQTLHRERRGLSTLSDGTLSLEQSDSARYPERHRLFSTGN